MAARKTSRKKQESYLFVLMGLILLLLLISGYFLFVEKFLPELTSSLKNPKNPPNQVQGNSAPNPGFSENLLLSGEGQSIVLYFGIRGKGSLVGEQRRIPEEKEFLKLARTIIESLVAGPVGTGYSTIPPGTRLRSLFFHHGTFFVDFSTELSKNHPGGVLEENLTIFSVVNTLTELDKKAKVQFLINGNQSETLKGHLSLKQAFSRNEALIK